MPEQDAINGYTPGKEMSTHRAAMLILIVTLLQTTLVGKVSITGLKPELLLILTCFLLLSLPEGKALTAVFALGLISDTYSLAPFGLTAMSFLLLGAILLRTWQGTTGVNLLTWCGVLAGATLFNGLLHLAVLRMTLSEPLPSSLPRLLLLALINAFTGACLFPFLRRSATGSRGLLSGGREIG